MTETTEKQKEMAERYHSTDSKDLKIKSLEAQVTSLTKKRDQLKNDIEKRMQVADKIFKENRDLKSQLSNRDKEIKELKETVKPTIDCLEALLFAAGEDGTHDLDYEFIQNTALDYGCLTSRCPTQEELDDPDWWGHEYEIKEGDDGVVDITLPDLEALASLQSKEGE